MLAWDKLDQQREGETRSRAAARAKSRGSSSCPQPAAAAPAEEASSSRQGGQVAAAVAQVVDSRAALQSLVMLPSTRS